MLRRTELDADLEAVRADYTDANPKILDLRFEISALDKALEKIYAVKPTETGKLTLALGKMLVKRASLETEVTRLLRTYTNEQTEVKRARRRVEIFDAAIKEILP
jgi:capsule polysaccharide export protein KpsE/RkpR